MNSSKFIARLQQLDWLGLCLVSWVGPLAFDAWRPLTYATSLLFWLLPTFLLWPRFAALTDPGGRRRTAFAIAVTEIVVLGLLLDFGFGRWILAFACDIPGQYLVCLRGVPIEEVFFYILGPIAILLVYVWNDEYWMPAYNPVRARIDFARTQQPIIVFSWPPLAIGVALEVIGLAVKWHHPDGPVVPLYFTYLVVLAFVPAIALFGRVSAFVNWRALGMTVLYLVVTSMIWEPILALPRGWWWYQDSAMMGIWTNVFTKIDTRRLPIEAVLVWIAAPFSSVLTYEAIKTWLYRRRPNKAVFKP
jgi:hypothetical protein